MRHSLSKLSCAIVASAGTVLASSDAAAQLQEQEVLLLYNSQVAESLAIRNAYIAVYPNVLQYDLDLSYPIITSNTRSSTPPTGGINNQYITPDAFKDIFLDPGDFQTFLGLNPGIIAIVTTRGLPGAISTNFDPDVTWVNTDGIVGAFERALAAMRTTPGGDISFTNPYFNIPLPIHEYLALCDDEGYQGEGKGDFFLVTRLDAGRKNFNCTNEPTYPDPTDGVLDLISRSASLPPVNKFAVGLIFDWEFLAPNPDHITPWSFAASRMWLANWPVLHEVTDELFIHGPLDPNFESPEDDISADYPTLVLNTYGRNHPKTPGCSTCDTIGRCYTRYYNAHPAGFFFSYESFNGFRVHSHYEPNNSSQGDILDWISASGGSFAIGFVAEPTFLGAGSVRPQNIIVNLYERGLTWAEASASGVSGRLETVIGDPLARVTVYNPDLDDDGIVYFDDVNLMLASISASNLEHDLNGDGVVDLDDLEIVLDAFGRSKGSAPAFSPSNPEWLTPWANAGAFIPGRCSGDMNGDLVIDFADINILASYVTDGSCPDLLFLGDLNNDGVVDASDTAIVTANFGRKIGDFNNDGFMDEDDFALLCAQVWIIDPNLFEDPDVCDLLPPPYTCVGWDAKFDLDCNGLIDCRDIEMFLAAIPGAGECKACDE